MSAFTCPVCGGDHANAKAVVQVRGARKLADLPPMTVAEFVAAYPTYSVDINYARLPPAMHIAANGEPGQLVMATLEDERLHPGNYPVRLADGRWVTVNGVFKLERAAQDFESSRDTPAGRFFQGGRSAAGMDPVLVDALIVPSSPEVAAAVKARNAAFLAAQQAAINSVDPEVADAVPATRSPSKAAALILDALKRTTDPALSAAAREAEVAALAPPFPVIEYEEITLPDGEVKKIPVRFTFSDGTVRTDRDFAVEANAAARAKLRI
jgi:hypothetical protein